MRCGECRACGWYTYTSVGRVSVFWLWWCGRVGVEWGLDQGLDGGVVLCLCEL